MKCFRCGNEIPDKSVFCGICGAKLAAEETNVFEDTAESLKGADVTDTEAAESPEAEEVIKPAEESEKFAEEISEGEAPEEVYEAAEETVEEVSGVITENACEEVNGELHDTEDSMQAADDVSDTFELKNCAHCGAALINGANYCSNCGSRAEEVIKESKPKRGGLLLGLCIAAVIIVAFMVNVFIGSNDIEGEWAVRDSGSMFDMFGESYLDFDDGTAVYYNGIFSVQEYRYSYNRFTHVLRLADEYGNNEAILHIDWVDENTCVIRELNMVLEQRERSDTYKDYEYDEDEAVMF